MLSFISIFIKYDQSLVNFSVPILTGWDADKFGSVRADKFLQKISKSCPYPNRWFVHFSVRSCADSEFGLMFGQYSKIVKYDRY